MTQNSLFDQTIACAEEIVKKFTATGTLDRHTLTGPAVDLEFSSLRYRRAHISTVDARETNKLYLLHVTVFPHTNDPSPIYGFDIVCGPTKVSGAFHDFSSGGETNHAMLAWFADQTRFAEWNKPRELPDWAKSIFSSSMVAIGAVGAEELAEFIDLGLKNLDYYLKNVGNTQQSLADYHMAQNRYCHYQKQNPRTPASLIHLGFTPEQAKDFVQNMLFPEIV
jgi:Ferredoxin-dependent bilin reductase